MNETKNELRPELEPLPERMKILPIDERGYVVPWFVDWIEKDGQRVPEFRAMNPKKWLFAVRFRMCWVCGDRLGRWMTFVAGPMCGINRTSSEPPSHLECARWSARNCPFLNNPEQIRRFDGDITPDGKMVGGFGILRNPGVTMLWTTQEYDVFPDGQGGRLLKMGEPQSVEWYHRGHPATRAEVQRSIDTGIHALEDAAMREGEEAIKQLREWKERFQKYLPSEPAK